MINWLHTWQPHAIAFSIGPLSVHWYGLFIVLGMASALLISLRLAKLYHLDRDLIFDLSFWLIINGLIGARLYEGLIEFSYYSAHPWSILKVWEGGLAIHGGIIAGLITLIYFSKKHSWSFWKLSALFAPGLALGQAIGRFGNYFNQELFGKPTNLPWGIPIDLLNRPLEYLSSPFFHPTFLYESLGLLIIFIILLTLTLITSRRQTISLLSAKLITGLYILLASALRLMLEFIKIDYTPVLFGWRLPQITSLVLIIIFLIFIIFTPYEKTNQSS